MPWGSSRDEEPRRRPQPTEEEEDWVVARRGICLVLNNRSYEATALFQNKGDSIQLGVGHAYIAFMNAVMTCEADSLEKALSTLRDLESKCAANLGWLRAMKNTLLGRNDLSTYESVEQQIALADCQVCIAFLSLMTGQDSATGWVKGGWALRKAWGLYHGAYSFLSGEYRRVFGLGVQLPGSDSTPWRVLSSDQPNSGASTPLSPSGSWSIPTTPSAETPTNGYKRHWTSIFSPVQTPQMCPEEIRRLMGATCFGYGLFHLCVSMLPGTLLRLIQMLGFSGDRVIGLDALMFARRGPDMRAPLATLALLWYHTMMRPLLASDPQAISASIVAAETLLEESKQEFAESALFLFFHGRVYRLKAKIEEAIKSYREAMAKSGQRELSLLCLHETAWCHLIQLDFPVAYRAFSQLRGQSHWSKAFYAYLCAVCGGCTGSEDALALLVPPLLRLCGPLSQLDTIITRRAGLLLPYRGQFYYRLLAYEMIYLWNSFPSQDGLKTIISDCEGSRDDAEGEPMTGLVPFILGVCYSRLGQYSRAKDFLKEALSRRSASCGVTSSSGSGSGGGERAGSQQGKAASDTHLSACALYELAIVHLTSQQEDTAEGVRLLETVLTQYSGYDFESRLSLRIHAALREYRN